MYSTKRQLEGFVEGFVWEDLRDTLEDWATGVKDDALVADSMDEVRRCQGRIEALNYFLELPQTMIESFEHEEGDKDGTQHDATSG